MSRMRCKAARASGGFFSTAAKFTTRSLLISTTVMAAADGMARGCPLFHFYSTGLLTQLTGPS